MDDRVVQAAARSILRPRGGFLWFALDEEARDRTPHSTKSQHPRRWQRRSVRTGPCPRHSRRDELCPNRILAFLQSRVTIPSVKVSSSTFDKEPRPPLNAKVRNTSARFSPRSKVRILARTQPRSARVHNYFTLNRLVSN